MRTSQEQHRVGTRYVEDATVLLQRVRNAHPTKGLYEAAELQWWWRKPRSTDSHRQLFWFDDLGRPEAAMIATDWGTRVTLDPIVMPDATPDWVAEVVERGLTHAGQCGFDAVELEVDRINNVVREVLFDHDFSITEDGIVETWLTTNEKPEISPLHHGYRLASRHEARLYPHHMIERNGPQVEERLQQTSLYRADLDLLVLDDSEDVAAYGLFWFDPETLTGVIEPMRTEDDHQRRGLAHHILTSGIDLLAKAGAVHIKICFEPDNPASKDLYLSVGFQPVKQSDLFVGRVGPRTSQAGPWSDIEVTDKFYGDSAEGMWGRPTDRGPSA